MKASDFEKNKKLIEITGVDLIKLIQKVYENSEPQGMGFIHYRDDKLTKKEAESYINKDSDIIVHLDYVRGRACKFVVWQADGRLFTKRDWYDHSEESLKDLLKVVNS